MDQRSRVVAIGSPHGDDQAAWQVAGLLRNRGEINADAVVISDPSHLLDYMDECDRLIIVDACHGSGPPGSVTRMDWPDERISRQRPHSTHGIGIDDTLRLAENLGRLPGKVVVFGIELSQCDPNSTLTDAVKRAVCDAELLILRELLSELNQEVYPRRPLAMKQETVRINDGVLNDE